MLYVVCAARDGKSTRTLSYRQFALLATDTGLIDAKLPAKVLTSNSDYPQSTLTPS